MVVIRPKLGICWSYVAIYMYMTNILTVVIYRGDVVAVIVMYMSCSHRGSCIILNVKIY